MSVFDYYGHEWTTHVEYEMTLYIDFEGIYDAANFRIQYLSS